MTVTWTASLATDDTAETGDFTDLSAATGTLTFSASASQRTATFTVPTAQDTANEADETFTVTLSGVSSNAALAADPTATGTITNDDVPGAPTDFRAGVGDAQVDLSWDAPAPGANITRHEYRQKEGSGSYPPTWMQIESSAPGGTNEKGYTVTGLTNEVAHTFELRAVNDAGDGTAAEAGPVTPTPGICDRTQQVRDGIVDYLPLTRTCEEVNKADLAAITGILDLEDTGITSIQSGDFAGLTALTELYLDGNSLSSLPAGVFSGLSALTTLGLLGNGLEELLDEVFSGLTALTALWLDANSLDELPDEVFDGLSSLKRIYLDGNDLEELPDEVFSDLTGLTHLTLDDNPDSGDVLPLTVTVEKEGTDQVRAKVAAGAPFAVDFTPTVVNGSLAASDTKLAVEAGAVHGTPETVTRTSGTTAAVTVDIDLTTQPDLPTNHSGYEFVKATGSEPAEILPAETGDGDTLPTLSVDDAEATEGSPVSFTVALSAASTETVTVDWATLGLPGNLLRPAEFRLHGERGRLRAGGGHAGLRAGGYGEDGLGGDARGHDARGGRAVPAALVEPDARGVRGRGQRGAGALGHDSRRRRSAGGERRGRDRGRGRRRELHGAAV